MPSKSVKQQKFFGFLKAHPAESEKRGLAGKTVDEFASTKTKGLPEKVSKSKKDDDDVCPTCGK